MPLLEPFCFITFLKAPTSAFTIKNLLRHYANQVISGHGDMREGLLRALVVTVWREGGVTADTRAGHRGLKCQNWASVGASLHLSLPASCRLLFETRENKHWAAFYQPLNTTRPRAQEDRPIKHIPSRAGGKLGIRFLKTSQRRRWRREERGKRMSI